MQPPSRRAFLQTGAALAAAPFFVHCRKSTSNRPNIVFILADDLGWSDLGCYGNRIHQTPHINALAGQSVRFKYAYASGPTCVPPRASILTGKSPARMRLTDAIGDNPKLAGAKLIPPPNVFRHLTRRQTTIAERLKQQGYKTAHIGKWHLGAEGHQPKDQGFDFSFGGSEIAGPGSYFYPNWGKQPDISAKDGAYLTDRLTDEALRFLDENHGERFFLYLCHYAMHVPLEAPPALAAKYAGPNAAYAGMIDSLDRNTGRLLKKLDDLGLASRTVVFFTSDHGGLHVPVWNCTTPPGNAPLRAGKGYLYEGGLRTPLIVRWPGITQPGTLSKTPTISMDYHHTMAAIGGVEETLSKDGRNLVPVLERSARLQRSTMYWHYPHYNNFGGLPCGAIRTGPFKLVRSYEDQHSELYNIRDDPGESLNLMDEMPERADRFLIRLTGWIGSMRAPLMDPDRGWNPATEFEKLPWQINCPV